MLTTTQPCRLLCESMCMVDNGVPLRRIYAHIEINTFTTNLFVIYSSMCVCVTVTKMIDVRRSVGFGGKRNGRNVAPTQSKLCRRISNIALVVARCSHRRRPLYSLQYIACCVDLYAWCGDFTVRTRRVQSVVILFV